MVRHPVTRLWESDLHSHVWLGVHPYPGPRASVCGVGHKTRRVHLRDVTRPLGVLHGSRDTSDGTPGPLAFFYHFPQGTTTVTLRTLPMAKVHLLKCTLRTGPLYSGCGLVCPTAGCGHHADSTRRGTRRGGEEDRHDP